MYKNINFYLGKSEAINVSRGIDKFCLKLTIIAKDTYNYEDMKKIVDYINNNGINININNETKVCGECRYYEPEFGCMNDKSRARNKNLRTKNSKGCSYGEWN